jgi:hypothetical protein
MLHVSKLCMGDDKFEYFLLIFIYVLESGFDFEFTVLAVGEFYCLMILRRYSLKHLFGTVYQNVNLLKSGNLKNTSFPNVLFDNALHSVVLMLIYML